MLKYAKPDEWGAKTLGEQGKWSETGGSKGKQETDGDKAEVREVPVQPLQPQRFELSQDGEVGHMLEHLEEHGYAVIANAMSQDDIEQAENLLWDYLESAVPFSKTSRTDPQTWQQDWLPSPDNGIIGGFGFGQSDFMWKIRMLPRVKEAFRAIWGTDDLLVSFDGGNAFRPWQLNPTWITKGGWWHVDQNAWRGKHRQGKVCIQGLVTLTDVTEDTGGLCVIPGSSQRHDAVCKEAVFAKGWGDFVPISADSSYLQGQTGRLICARAGDLIVWDSRTIHCNTPALTDQAAEAQVVRSNMTPAERKASETAKPKDKRGERLLRMVAYVCMTPVKMATQEVLEKRKDGFINNVSTSHWPHAFVASGAALPDTPRKDPEAITEEQRRLIGYGYDLTPSVWERMKAFFSPSR